MNNQPATRESMNEHAPSLDLARARYALPMGLFGGLALGAIARLWMRGIAVDPEFTWGGTLGIMFGFALFGFAQAGVAVARRGIRRGARPAVLTVFRVIGVIAMLPLFLAAGGPMLPTVVAGGLAFARKDWRLRTRAALVAVATIPVFAISHSIIDDFGASVQAVVGVIGMVAIYATIIRATTCSFAPRPDGWKLPRWAFVTSIVAGCVSLAVPLALGGIT